MRIHKLEIIVLDPNEEELSIDDVKIQLENYMNDWIVHIISEETVKYDKEWEDDNPFNFGATKAKNAFKKLLN